MNKPELVKAIATGSGLSKIAASKALDATVTAITSAVAQGEQVSIFGFGSFRSAVRAARTGKNPKTGASLRIAETVVPKFYAGTGFKSAVSGKN